MTQEGKMNWISVEKRLPAQYESVLLYLTPVAPGPDWYPRTNYTQGWRKRDFWFGTFINMETGLVEEGEIPEGLVPHWMPVPSPHSAEKEGR